MAGFFDAEKKKSERKRFLAVLLQIELKRNKQKAASVFLNRYFAALSLFDFV